MMSLFSALKLNSDETIDLDDPLPHARIGTGDLCCKSVTVFQGSFTNELSAESNTR